MTPFIQVIPHLCGLSKAKRERRRLIMAKVFVDDSGNSAEEPLMWLGGWVGEVPTWDQFADQWHAALVAPNPKPIRYFKHYEARSLTGNFERFTELEAVEKTSNLARVLANGHAIYGVAYCLSRPFLNRMIERHAINRVHPYLKDPFYTCLNCIVGYVIGSQYQHYPNDKVDFIFDGTQGSKQANRVMAQWDTIRDLLPEPLPTNVGSVLPMNDLDVLPLQAADLFVGQLRQSFIEKPERDAPPLEILRRRIPMWIKLVDEETIRSTISYHNFGVSTQRLSALKREKESKERKLKKKDCGT
jgi:hypothetical protein